MKLNNLTFILFLCLFLTGQTVFAQWTTSGANIYNSNTGNVGIGTNSPSAMLNVDPKGAGGILIGNPNTASGGYTSLYLRISASQNGYSEIQSVASSGSTWGNLSTNDQGAMSASAPPVLPRNFP